MIYVLPGMGADSGMYSGAWRNMPDSKFLDWPAYHGESTIAEVAKRMANDFSIPDGAQLVGSSLGGMVACEIARLRTIPRLFLVGSAKKKEEISSLLRAIHPLVDLAPLEFIQRASGKLPSELTQMFSRAQAPFVRAMCRAVFDWRGLDETATRLFRIHGRKDQVIPVPKDAQRILNGGHLIAMTHPSECVAFIEANQTVP